MPPLTPDQAKRSVLGTPRHMPVHLSYSGMNTMQDCPKRYELSYIAQAPRKGAVWFLGGKAVHRATEEWDLARVEGRHIDLPKVWKDVFMEELASSKEGDPDFTNWRKAGTRKDNPVGEDIAHWFSDLGPQLVKAYVNWRNRSSWDIWRTPDGKPAIELDVGGTWPNAAMPFKGFIDRVFQSPQTGQLLLVDLKTGTRKPENGLQLGVYSAAVETRWGVPIHLGAAFMNRRGDLSEAWNLDLYTPEYVGRMFDQTDRAIKAGYFVAVPGRHCGLCDVAAACHANGGPLAQGYDPDSPGNQPGF